MYFNDGSKYEGEYKNDYWDGKGTFYWKNGDKYEGEWKNNEKYGKGIMYYNNGNRFEGEWKNDKKEGEGILFHTNGDKEIEYYLKGPKTEKHELILSNKKSALKVMNNSF